MAMTSVVLHLNRDDTQPAVHVQQFSDFVAIRLDAETATCALYVTSLEQALEIAAHIMEQATTLLARKEDQGKVIPVAFAAVS